MVVEPRMMGTRLALLLSPDDEEEGAWLYVGSLQTEARLSSKAWTYMMQDFLHQRL